MVGTVYIIHLLPAKESINVQTAFHTISVLVDLGLIEHLMGII